MGKQLALGSHNQAKQKAIFLATGIQPQCVSVPSGVSEQPLSEDETIRGAIARAKQALEAVPDAEIGLGLEGGLTFDAIYTKQWYLISICAAWNGEALHIGKGLAFPIPNHIGEDMKTSGRELREVIDSLSGTKNSNHKEGAYGLFTDGKITRAHVFKEAVIAALTPFESVLYR
ncbi:DUF84 family protein [Brevibacillus laterosporus]|uniref:inosine/xanthosine triphosphatase n=1 Tax=Brevibacillus laterosporus TaxID=1465 RepID=A0AAP8Q8Z3_BRELA|nr:inosine/xanthosine triphosphatase [Brevibacillus laterosporus]PPA91259.1 DUF84 domain-containing protein [Brevibacillus laterosporus]